MDSVSRTLPEFSDTNGVPSKFVYVVPRLIDGEGSGIRRLCFIVSANDLKLLADTAREGSGELIIPLKR